MFGGIFKGIHIVWIPLNTNSTVRIHLKLNPGVKNAGKGKRGATQTHYNNNKNWEAFAGYHEHEPESIVSVLFFAIAQITV